MRDVNEITSISVYKNGWVGTGGAYAGTSNQNTFSGTLLQSGSGRSTLIKGNGISPTAYSAYRFSAQGGDFDCYSKGKTNGAGTWIDAASGKYPLSNSTLIAVGLGPSPIYPPGVDHGVKVEARTRALNKLLDAKIDLGESLGSIKQTATMVSRTLMNLITAFRALLRGNVKLAAKALGVRGGNFGKRSRRGRVKGTASDWLALQFGWLPLMNDIFNGVSEINKALNGKPPLLRVTATKVRPKTLPTLVGTYSYGDSGTDEGVTKAAITQGCQVGLVYKVNSSTIHGLSNLNVLNPLHVAWQLLPMSFVYDWFVSVGNVLSGLSADWGLTLFTGYETYFVKGGGQLEYNGFKSRMPLGDHPKWSVSVFGMERVPLQYSPKPGLYLPSGMDFNSTTSALSHLGTMVSLIAQRG